MHLNIVFVDILANIIIQQYFSTSRCIIIFTDDTNNFSCKGNVPFLQVSADDVKFPDTVLHYFGCQEIIIKSNKPKKTLVKIEHMIRYTLERFNSRKYLILPAENMEEDINDIFKLKEMDYISDILIAVEKEDMSFEILSNQYVGQNNNNKIVLVDVWFSVNGSFLMGKTLYPNKLHNQEGRNLRMATFQYEPYSVIGETIKTSYGSELKTAITFALKYNMTPVPVVNEYDYWGEIFSNWSGNGLLGNLVSDNADIGFAALYTWEAAYVFLELSKPLVRTGITCLVPAPKLAAGWLTPMYSFSLEMWIIVGGMFIFSTLVGTLINSCYIRNKDFAGSYKKTFVLNDSYISIFGDTAFNIFKVILVQAIPSVLVPRGFVGQLFFSIFLMYSVILTSLYDSGFASIMTIPRYEAAINTVYDFEASGLHWGATQDAWTTSIQGVNQQPFINIVERFKSTSEEKLREYSKRGHFAFSLERLPHDNFAIGTYIKDDVIQNYHVMKYDFYWEQCVIMSKKSSILLPMLDMFILRSFEAGLITFWQNEAVTLSMDQVVQKAVKYYYYHDSERTFSALTFNQVEGAFGLLILGHILSLIVFILEILLFNNTKKDKPIHI